MNIFKPLSQTILGDPNLRFLKPTQPYFITRKRNEYQEFIHLETHTGTSLTEPDGMEPSKSYEDSSVPYFQWVRDRQRLTINSISLVSGLSTSHADKYVDPNDISYVMLTENVTPSAAQQQPGLSTSQPVNPDKLKDHDHSPPSTPILPLTVTENTVPDISLQHDDMAVDVTTSKARGVVQTIPFESPSISASPATHHDNSDDVDPSPWKQLDDYEVVRDVILEEYRDLSRRSSPKPESSAEKLGPDPESESRNEYFPDNEPGEAPPSSPRIYSTTKSQKGTFDERYTKSGHTDWIYRSATMKAYEPAGVNEFRLMASEMVRLLPVQTSFNCDIECIMGCWLLGARVAQDFGAWFQFFSYGTTFRIHVLAGPRRDRIRRYGSRHQSGNVF
jgi:hypothetical protein